MMNSIIRHPFRNLHFLNMKMKFENITKENNRFSILKAINTLCIVLMFPWVGASQTSFSVDTLLMGSVFSFTAVNRTAEQARGSTISALDEVIRIEKLISSWDKNSETHQININAGIKPVEVSLELFNLIERSIKVSKLTNGLFDISFASIDKVWDFKHDYVNVPDSTLIFNSIEKINYQNILLDRQDQTVFLTEKGMKIGFGAIGKGYAANRAKSLMIENGSLSGVVNAGGDLICWGSKPDGKPWSVGVADPFQKDKIKLWLDRNEGAVVTSGDYERYVIIQGVRYGHIINPKTGWPTKGIRSVTVLSPDAELADALATSVFVMGTIEGLSLINQLQGIECFIIDDENTIHYSENLKRNYIHFEE